MAPIDPSARPMWKRTGYKFFPYAAEQSGAWWVLRFNTGFPEHDLYTVFVDGRAAADVTGDAGADVALVASVGALSSPDVVVPVMDPAVARTVVAGVARFADYGSEVDDPCMFCADGHDGLALEA